MAVAVEQFLTRLTGSGLMTEAERRAFFDSLPESIETAEDVVAALLEQDRLTKYQAQVLLGQRQDPLLLGNYLLLDKIGEGGMGQVFKALHRRMERFVALKILPRSATESETAVKRFHREVKAASQLQHANIVIAFDADEADGVHFLVMEFVRGQNLAELVKANGPLPLETAIDFTLQIARGLEYAHGEGIVHRDIKPRNLLLKMPRKAQGSQSGSQMLKPTVKILDMGLALWEPNDPRIAPPSDLTQSGAVMGTADYMSPEQAEDTHTADARSDIYSLGCTLYYLLTGHAMYAGDSLVKKLLAHRDEPIPSLRDERPDVSERLDAIYRRMVAKSPEDRYPHMTAVIAELQDLQSPSAGGGSSLDNSGQTAALSGVTEEPELQQFLQAQSQPQTVTYKEPEPEPEPSASDTFADQSAERTLPSTVERTYAKTKRKRQSRKGLAIGLGLLGVVVAIVAGVIIKLKTPNGTIVLEFDQADMAGAEVTIDDKHVVTIKTAKGEKPITVAADGKKRLLKVTKAGFETFTREFSLKKGDRKVVTVRLEPLERPNGSFSNPDRAVAVWVVSKGGFVATRVVGDPSWTHKRIRKADGLPRAKFGVHNVYLNNTGTTDDDVAFLAKLCRSIRGRSNHFHQLSLGNTRITDAGLAHLRDIRMLTLTLGNNKIDGSGLRHLRDHKTLRTLNLTGCAVSDDAIQHLRGIPNLSTLFLISTKVTDNGLPALERIGTLKVLHIWRTKVTAAGVAKLQKTLPKCKIEWDGNISIDRKVALWVLQHGGTLRVGHNHRGIRVEKVSDLPSGSIVVHHIHVPPRTKVDDVVLKLLASLEHLGAFGFPENSMDDEALAKLIVPRKREGLYSLQLGNSRLTDNGIAELRKLPNLTHLHLYGSRITDGGLKHLLLLKELQVLGLSSTGISNRGLDNLAKLPKLHELRLGATAITDDALQKLAPLKTLRLLNVEKTQVTAAGVAKLQKALPKCKIVWDGDSVAKAVGCPTLACIVTRGSASRTGTQLLKQAKRINDATTGCGDMVFSLGMRSFGLPGATSAFRDYGRFTNSPAWE